MAAERLPDNDPRTLARDIPGILDALFPLLTPGVVAYFNRTSYSFANCEPVPAAIVLQSNLQRAMLFEVAVAAGEQMLATNNPVDWDACLKLAVARQRRHFDAKLPTALAEPDRIVARHVASNLVAMLNQLRVEIGGRALVLSPHIPGYQWIASGNGDFSIGRWLIEVKCTNKRFSSSDYRQIVMYWLLSYASAVENRSPEWSHGILMNPRLNFVVSLPFDQIVGITGAGRSKVELLETFAAMVGDRTFW